MQNYHEIIDKTEYCVVYAKIQCKGRAAVLPRAEASSHSTAGTAPQRTTSTSALCLSGFLALDTIHPSDSTFAFGSEISYTFIFWLIFQTSVLF